VSGRRGWDTGERVAVKIVCEEASADGGRFETEIWNGNLEWGN
jgi:hypothetical protein